MPCSFNSCRIGSHSSAVSRLDWLPAPHGDTHAALQRVVWRRAGMKSSPQRFSAMTLPMTAPTQPPAPAGRRRLPPVVRRLLWLGVVGVAAVGAAQVYKYLWYARPVGHGPAGPAVAAERFEHEHETWS